MQTVDSGTCFACGPRNPRGLHLRFNVDAARHEATAVTRVLPDFAGWPNTTHGGIVATLLDEAMVYACMADGEPVATAELTVRYKRPVPVDTPLTVSGACVEHHRRLRRATGRIEHNGIVLAEAKATLFVVAVADAPKNVKAGGSL